MDAGQTASLGVSNAESTFEQAAGTLDVLGSFKLNRGTFNYSGGTINGTPELGGGTFKLGTGVTTPFSFQINGPSEISLSDAVLSAGQTIKVQSTAAYSNNGFTNRGTIVINGTLFDGFRVVNGTLTNDSSGLLRVTSQGEISANITNNGTISIEAETSYGKATGLVTNNHQFTVASGRHFYLRGNGGTPTFDQAAGTLDIQGAFTQYGGKFRYSGGTIQGTVEVNGAALEIADTATGPASFLLTGSNDTLVIGANGISAGQVITLRSDSSFPLNVTSANGFTNNGSIRLTASAGNAARLTVSAGTLTNGVSGVLHFQSGGTGTNGTRLLNAPFVNNGTVIVDRSTEFSKSFTNQGQFTIASGQTASLTSPGDFEQTGGTTTVNGSLGQSFPTLFKMKFTAGNLTGSGSVGGFVDSIGATVEPGQGVGKLNVTNYRQGDAASLVVEIGGKANHQFDGLIASDKVILGGTLDVRFVNLTGAMFAPQTGDLFTIVTANAGFPGLGGLSGQFSNLLLPSLAPEQTWRVRYASNSVSLFVTLPSDFNGDGIVAASDYVLWRNSLGQTVVAGTGADADFDGQITGNDFDIWRAHFGRVAGSGGVGASQTGAVPEPGAALIIAAAALAGCAIRGRRRVAE